MTKFVIQDTENHACEECSSAVTIIAPQSGEGYVYVCWECERVYYPDGSVVQYGPTDKGQLSEKLT